MTTVVLDIPFKAHADLRHNALGTEILRRGDCHHPGKPQRISSPFETRRSDFGGQSEAPVRWVQAIAHLDFINAVEIEMTQ